MVDNFAEKGQRVSTKLELLRLWDIVCSLMFMKKYHLPFLRAGSSCKHSEKGEVAERRTWEGQGRRQEVNYLLL